MKDAVAQRGVDMSVGLVDGIFDRSLVFGFICPGRLRHTKVVVGKVVHPLAQCRLVTVRLPDGRLKVVGHKYSGYSSEELQCPGRSRQKLLYPLRTDACYECHSRERQYGHVRLYEDFLICLVVNVRQTVSCEVYKHLLPRLIQVLEQCRRLDSLDMLRDMVTEL